MRTDLAYIDDVMEKGATFAEANISLSDSAKAKARKDAIRSVAGFRVLDAEVEKGHLDRMLSEQKDSLIRYRKDRKDCRAKLEKHGIAALAVVPSRIWDAICDKAGLYRFYPSHGNQVALDSRAFEGMTSKQIQKLTHLELLPKYMPERYAGPHRNHGYQVEATLVLPPPPADVAEILCKAVKLSTAIKVAAVAEAISFAESPFDLLDRHRKDLEEDRLRELARQSDPIVYTEYGTATAVIAQFGEFPIEKEVVDAVVEAQGFIPEKSTGVDASDFVGTGQVFTGPSGIRWVTTAATGTGVTGSYLSALFGGGTHTA